jgi:hypothetical protein
VLKKIREYPAVDQSGNNHTMEYWENAMPIANVWDGNWEMRLNGKKLNPLSQGKFKEPETGLILTCDDPTCPC